MNYLSRANVEKDGEREIEEVLLCQHQRHKLKKRFELPQVLTIISEVRHFATQTMARVEIMKLRAGEKCRLRFFYSFKVSEKVLAIENN